MDAHNSESKYVDTMAASAQNPATNSTEHKYI